MPKKTRRQKIQAKNRRPKLNLNILSESPVVKNPAPVSFSDKSQLDKVFSEKPETEKLLFPKQDGSVKVFQTDLKKSLFITIMLIVIQLCLYYADKNHYLDLASIIR